MMVIRDRKIDVLKGIAIILVVLGHVISGVYDKQNYAENLIFKICYSFHMPLFIYISGYLTGKKENYGNEWIASRIRRLCIPYCVWTLISCIVYLKVDQIFIKLFIQPSYWFLINLFLYDAAVFVSYKLKKYWIAQIIIYSIFILMYAVFKDSNGIIINFVIFYPFYLSGLFISKNESKNWFKILNNYLWISVFLYPFSMFFYTYSSKRYGYQINRIMEFTGFDSANLVKAALTFYNHYIVAFLGICFVYFIVEKIKCLKNSRLLLWGGVTLQIYVLHGYFNLNYFNNKWIDSIASFCIGLSLPCIIAYFISKNKYLNYILFGYELKEIRKKDR